MTPWLRRLSGAHEPAHPHEHPDELPVALWAFVYFFALLAGYYVLRPLRDEMGMQVGVANLQLLFSAVFVAMLLLVPLWGAVLRRFDRRTVLPWLYAFFAANLLGFWTLMSSGDQQSLNVARAFYVWVSIFNLFAVSVFWSFMADLLRTEQAERLYGFIAAGGTAGALAGPLLTQALVDTLGARGLTLVSAAFLGVVIVALMQLRRWGTRHAVWRDRAESHEGAAMQGSVWSGLLDIVRSPYLLGICVFLFAYSLLSTFLYFFQNELVPAAITDSKERVRLLSQVDLAVNVLTLGFQVFAFSSVIQRVGILPMLVAMPLVSVLGFGAMALAPTLVTLVIFGVLRRAGEYAVSKPARETLFNVLPPEQKYKAKNVIDTLVHRGGDTSSAWIFAGFRGAGLSSTAIAWISVPIAAVWLVVAWLLGRRAQVMRDDRT